MKNVQLSSDEMDEVIFSITSDYDDCVHNFAPLFKLIEDLMNEQAAHAWLEGQRDGWSNAVFEQENGRGFMTNQLPRRYRDRNPYKKV